MEKIEPCAMDELGQPANALLAAFSTPFAAICGCATAVAARTVAKIADRKIGLILTAMWWALMDSNHRPTDYESAALTG